MGDYQNVRVQTTQPYEISVILNNTAGGVGETGTSNCSLLLDNVSTLLSSLDRKITEQQSLDNQQTKKTMDTLAPPKPGQVSGIIDELYSSLLKLIRAAAAATMVRIQKDITQKYPIMRNILKSESKSPQYKVAALAGSKNDLLSFQQSWEKVLVMVRGPITTTDHRLAQEAAALYKDMDASRRALVSSMQRIAQNRAKNEQTLLLQLYEQRLTTIRAAMAATNAMLNIYQSELEKIAIAAEDFQKRVDQRLQHATFELQKIIDRFFEDWKQASQEYFGTFGTHPCAAVVKNLEEALKAVCPSTFKVDIGSAKRCLQVALLFRQYWKALHRALIQHGKQCETASSETNPTLIEQREKIQNNLQQQIDMVQQRLHVLRNPDGFPSPQQWMAELNKWEKHISELHKDTFRMQKRCKLIENTHSLAVPSLGTAIIASHAEWKQCVSKIEQVSEKIAYRVRQLETVFERAANNTRQEVLTSAFHLKEKVLAQIESAFQALEQTEKQNIQQAHALFKYKRDALQDTEQFVNKELHSHGVSTQTCKCCIDQTFFQRQHAQHVAALNKQLRELRPIVQAVVGACNNFKP
jgi:hypothetical protein